MEAWIVAAPRLHHCMGTTEAQRGGATAKHKGCGHVNTWMAVIHRRSPPKWDGGGSG